MAIVTPVAAQKGAFEFPGSNQMRNKSRTSIMKNLGRTEDQPQAPASTILVLVLMISVLKSFSASASHFDNTSFDFPSFGSESLKLLDIQGNASVLSPNLQLSLSQPNQSGQAIGATGAAFEYHIVHSWEFSSSLRFPAEKTALPWWKWLLIVVGIVVGLGIVAWVRNRSKADGRYPSKKQSEVNNAPQATEENKTEIERGGEEGGHSPTLTEELENYGGPKKFSSEELVIATGSFADDRIVGTGGSGIVYKGHIGDARTPVAVKKITSGSRQGIEEYKSEVKSLSQLNHRNLVRLIGYCHEAIEFVLVYEFISGGSLEDHLFKSRTLLTWQRRYNIALGLASALHYLQNQCRRCIIHRDIKCSNVMLDEKFTPILGDFGLAKPVDDTRRPNTTQVKGTPGYLAPEYYRTGKASKESDIYSLGVVLLELVCGRKACDPDPAEQGRDLVQWVWKRYGRRSRSWRWFWNVDLPVDERLGKDFDKKQAEALMMAGLWCAHPIAESRPSIEVAMAVLKLKAEPPKLPFKMPVPDI